jgi:heme-degrading monooxygenase HmoA
MFVSVTRLHLRSARFLLPFLVYTWRSGRQAKRSRGFRGGMLGNDAQRGNWTITLWDSDAEMRAFRNSGPHATAMRKLLEWCDEASFSHYTAEDGALPSADAAYDRLLAGRTSKVNHPSAAHTEGRTVSAGKPRFAVNLRPPS